MQSPREIGEREVQIARVLRPLGRGPMRTRTGRARGPTAGCPLDHGLSPSCSISGGSENVCAGAGRGRPPRRTLAAGACGRGDRLVGRRPVGPAAARARTPRAGHLQRGSPALHGTWSRGAVTQHGGAQAAFAPRQGTPASGLSPGRCNRARQLRSGLAVGDRADRHTQADVPHRRPLHCKVIGRPWLSVAIDLATRTVPAFFIGMERPGAGTVASWSAASSSPRRPGWLTWGCRSTGRWPACRSGCTWTTRLSSAAAPFAWAALSTASRSTTGRSAARTMAATSSA